MTESQKIQLRQSEVRSRMAELRGQDNLDGDELGELETLTVEMRGLEVKLRSALVDEATAVETAGAFTDDGEAAEHDALLERVTLGTFYETALQQRASTGAEAELQAAHGLQSNEIPLALLWPGGIGASAQERTVTITNSGTSASMPLTPHILQAPGAEFIGARLVQVPRGQANIPVITSAVGIPSAAVAVGTAVTDGSVTLVNYNLGPSRLQKQILVGRDQDLLNPDLDRELRAHLSRAVAAGIDEFIVKAGVAHYTEPSDPTSKVAWADIRNALVDQIDGIYARGLGDVRLLCHPDTLKVAAKDYQITRGAQPDASGTLSDTIPGPLPAQVGETDAIQWLNTRTAGVSAFAGLTSSSNIDDAMIVAGPQANITAPIWDRVELSDPYSKSSEGQYRLTAAAYVNAQVVQTDALSRHKFKTTA